MSAPHRQQDCECFPWVTAVEPGAPPSCNKPLAAARAFQPQFHTTVQAFGRNGQIVHPDVQTSQQICSAPCPPQPARSPTVMPGMNRCDANQDCGLVPRDPTAARGGGGACISHGPEELLADANGAMRIGGRRDCCGCTEQNVNGSTLKACHPATVGEQERPVVINQNIVVNLPLAETRGRTQEGDGADAVSPIGMLETWEMPDMMSEGNSVKHSARGSLPPPPTSTPRDLRAGDQFPDVFSSPRSRVDNLVPLNLSGIPEVSGEQELVAMSARTGGPSSVRCGTVQQSPGRSGGRQLCGCNRPGGGGVLDVNQLGPCQCSQNKPRSRCCGAGRSEPPAAISGDHVSSPIMCVLTSARTTEPVTAPHQIIDQQDLALENDPNWPVQNPRVPSTTRGVTWDNAAWAEPTPARHAAPPDNLGSQLMQQVNSASNSGDASGSYDRHGRFVENTTHTRPPEIAKQQSRHAVHSPYNEVFQPPPVTRQQRAMNRTQPAEAVKLEPAHSTDSGATSRVKSEPSSDEVVQSEARLLTHEQKIAKLQHIIGKKQSAGAGSQSGSKIQRSSTESGLASRVPSEPSDPLAAKTETNRSKHESGRVLSSRVKSAESLGGRSLASSKVPTVSLEDGDETMPQEILMQRHNTLPRESITTLVMKNQTIQSAMANVDPQLLLQEPPKKLKRSRSKKRGSTVKEVTERSNTTSTNATTTTSTTTTKRTSPQSSPRRTKKKKATRRPDESSVNSEGAMDLVFAEQEDGPNSATGDPQVRLGPSVPSKTLIPLQAVCSCGKKRQKGVLCSCKRPNVLPSLKEETSCHQLVSPNYSLEDGLPGESPSPSNVSSIFSQDGGEAATCGPDQCKFVNSDHQIITPSQKASSVSTKSIQPKQEQLLEGRANTMRKKKPPSTTQMSTIKTKSHGSEKPPMSRTTSLQSSIRTRSNNPGGDTQGDRQLTIDQMEAASPQSSITHTAEIQDISHEGDDVLADTSVHNPHQTLKTSLEQEKPGCNMAPAAHYPSQGGTAPFPNQGWTGYAGQQQPPAQFAYHAPAQNGGGGGSQRGPICGCWTTDCGCKSDGRREQRCCKCCTCTGPLVLPESVADETVHEDEQPRLLGNQIQPVDHILESRVRASRQARECHRFSRTEAVHSEAAPVSAEEPQVESCYCQQPTAVRVSQNAYERADLCKCVGTNFQACPGEVSEGPTKEEINYRVEPLQDETCPCAELVRSLVEKEPPAAPLEYRPVPSSTRQGEVYIPPDATDTIDFPKSAGEELASLSESTRRPDSSRCMCGIPNMTAVNAAPAQLKHHTESLYFTIEAGLAEPAGARSTNHGARLAPEEGCPAQLGQDSVVPIESPRKSMTQIEPLCKARCATTGRNATPKSACTTPKGVIEATRMCSCEGEEKVSPRGVSVRSSEQRSVQWSDKQRQQSAGCCSCCTCGGHRAGCSDAKCAINRSPTRSACRDKSTPSTVKCANWLVHGAINEAFVLCAATPPDSLASPVALQGGVSYHTSSTVQPPGESRMCECTEKQPSSPCSPGDKCSQLTLSVRSHPCNWGPAEDSQSVTPCQQLYPVCPDAMRLGADHLSVSADSSGGGGGSNRASSRWLRRGRSGKRSQGRRPRSAAAHSLYTGEGTSRHSHYHHDCLPPGDKKRASRNARIDAARRERVRSASISFASQSRASSSQGSVSPARGRDAAAQSISGKLRRSGGSKNSRRLSPYAASKSKWRSEQSRRSSAAPSRGSRSPNVRRSRGRSRDSRVHHERAFSVVDDNIPLQDESRRPTSRYHHDCVPGRGSHLSDEMSIHTPRNSPNYLSADDARSAASSRRSKQRKKKIKGRPRSTNSKRKPLKAKKNAVENIKSRHLSGGSIYSSMSDGDLAKSEELTDLGSEINTAVKSHSGKKQQPPPCCDNVGLCECAYGKPCADKHGAKCRTTRAVRDSAAAAAAADSCNSVGGHVLQCPPSPSAQPAPSRSEQGSVDRAPPEHECCSDVERDLCECALGRPCGGEDKRGKNCPRRKRQLRDTPTHTPDSSPRHTDRHDQTDPSGGADGGGGGGGMPGGVEPSADDRRRQSTGDPAHQADSHTPDDGKQQGGQEDAAGGSSEEWLAIEAVDEGNSPPPPRPRSSSGRRQGGRSARGATRRPRAASRHIPTLFRPRATATTGGRVRGRIAKRRRVRPRASQAIRAAIPRRRAKPAQKRNVAMKNIVKQYNNTRIAKRIHKKHITKSKQGVFKLTRRKRRIRRNKNNRRTGVPSCGRGTSRVSALKRASEATNDPGGQFVPSSRDIEQSRLAREGPPRQSRPSDQLAVRHPRTSSQRRSRSSGRESVAARARSSSKYHQNCVPDETTFRLLSPLVPHANSRQKSLDSQRLSSRSSRSRTRTASLSPRLDADPAQANEPTNSSFSNSDSSIRTVDKKRRPEKKLLTRSKYRNKGSTRPSGRGRKAREGFRKNKSDVSVKAEIGIQANLLHHSNTRILVDNHSRTTGRHAAPGSVWSPAGSKVRRSQSKSPGRKDNTQLDSMRPSSQYHEDCVPGDDQLSAVAPFTASSRVRRSRSRSPRRSRDVEPDLRRPSSKYHRDCVPGDDQLSAVAPSAASSRVRRSRSRSPSRSRDAEPDSKRPSSKYHKDCVPGKDLLSADAPSVASYQGRRSGSRSPSRSRDAEPDPKRPSSTYHKDCVPGDDQLSVVAPSAASSQGRKSRGRSPSRSRDAEPDQQRPSSTYHKDCVPGDDQISAVAPSAASSQGRRSRSRSPNRSREAEPDPKRPSSKYHKDCVPGKDQLSADAPSAASSQGRRSRSRSPSRSRDAEPDPKRPSSRYHIDCVPGKDQLSADAPSAASSKGRRSRSRSPIRSPDAEPDLRRPSSKYHKNCVPGDEQLSAVAPSAASSQGRRSRSRSPSRSLNTEPDPKRPSSRYHKDCVPGKDLLSADAPSAASSRGRRSRSRSPSRNRDAQADSRRPSSKYHKDCVPGDDQVSAVAPSAARSRGNRSRSKSPSEYQGGRSRSRSPGRINENIIRNSNEGRGAGGGPPPPPGYEEVRLRTIITIRDSSGGKSPRDERTSRAVLGAAVAAAVDMNSAGATSAHVSATMQQGSDPVTRRLPIDAPPPANNKKRRRPRAFAARAETPGLTEELKTEIAPAGTETEANAVVSGEAAYQRSVAQLADAPEELLAAHGVTVEPQGAALVVQADTLPQENMPLLTTREMRLKSVSASGSEGEDREEQAVAIPSSASVVASQRTGDRSQPTACSDLTGSAGDAENTSTTRQAAATRPSKATSLTTGPSTMLVITPRKPTSRPPRRRTVSSEVRSIVSSVSEAPIRMTKTAPLATPPPKRASRKKSVRRGVSKPKQAIRRRRPSRGTKLQDDRKRLAHPVNGAHRQSDIDQPAVPLLDFGQGLSEELSAVSDIDDGSEPPSEHGPVSAAQAEDERKGTTEESDDDSWYTARLCPPPPPPESDRAENPRLSGEDSEWRWRRSKVVPRRTHATEFQDHLVSDRGVSSDWETTSEEIILQTSNFVLEALPTPRSPHTNPAAAASSDRHPKPKRQNATYRNRPQQANQDTLSSPLKETVSGSKYHQNCLDEDARVGTQRRDRAAMSQISSRSRNMTSHSYSPNFVTKRRNPRHTFVTPRGIGRGRRRQRRRHSRPRAREKRPDWVGLSPPTSHDWSNRSTSKYHQNCYEDTIFATSTHLDANEHGHELSSASGSTVGDERGAGAQGSKRGRRNNPRPRSRSPRNTRRPRPNGSPSFTGGRLRTPRLRTPRKVQGPSPTRRHRRARKTPRSPRSHFKPHRSPFGGQRLHKGAAKTRNMQPGAKAGNAINGKKSRPWHAESEEMTVDRSQGKATLEYGQRGYHSDVSEGSIEISDWRTPHSSIASNRSRSQDSPEASRNPTRSNPGELAAGMKNRDRLSASRAHTYGSRKTKSKYHQRCYHDGVANRSVGSAGRIGSSRTNHSVRRTTHSRKPRSRAKSPGELTNRRLDHADRLSATSADDSQDLSRKSTSKYHQGCYHDGASQRHASPQQRPSAPRSSERQYKKMKRVLRSTPVRRLMKPKSTPVKRRKTPRKNRSPLSTKDTIGSTIKTINNVSPDSSPKGAVAQSGPQPVLRSGPPPVGTMQQTKPEQLLQQEEHISDTSQPVVNHASDFTQHLKPGDAFEEDQLMKLDPIKPGSDGTFILLTPRDVGKCNPTKNDVKVVIHRGPRPPNPPVQHDEATERAEEPHSPTEIKNQVLVQVVPEDAASQVAEAAYSIPVDAVSQPIGEKKASERSRVNVTSPQESNLNEEIPKEVEQPLADIKHGREDAKMMQKPEMNIEWRGIFVEALKFLTGVDDKEGALSGRGKDTTAAVDSCSCSACLELDDSCCSSESASPSSPPLLPSDMHDELDELHRHNPCPPPLSRIEMNAIREEVGMTPLLSSPDSMSPDSFSACECSCSMCESLSLDSDIQVYPGDRGCTSRGFTPIYLTRQQQRDIALEVGTVWESTDVELARYDRRDPGVSARNSPEEGRSAVGGNLRSPSRSARGGYAARESQEPSSRNWMTRHRLMRGGDGPTPKKTRPLPTSSSNAKRHSFGLPMSRHKSGN